MLCLVGHQGSHVRGDFSFLLVLKDTNVCEVKVGQFRFLSSPFWMCSCSRGDEAERACKRQGGRELPDISTDMRSASCNWSLFHLLSYLFVGRSLGGERHIIDRSFKDIKNK